MLRAHRRRAGGSVGPWLAPVPGCFHFPGWRQHCIPGRSSPRSCRTPVALFFLSLRFGSSQNKEEGKYRGRQSEREARRKAEAVGQGAVEGGRDARDRGGECEQRKVARAVSERGQRQGAI